MSSIAELHQTDSVRASQADARAQSARTSDYRPYRPASTSPHIPAGVDASALLWAETVAPGGYTHKVLARGTRIRFDDPTGFACAHVIVYNALETSERLNVADTVKIPWQAYLGAGHPLLSGDGRILATITGRHLGQARRLLRHHDGRVHGAQIRIGRAAGTGSVRPVAVHPGCREARTDAA